MDEANDVFVLFYRGNDSESKEAKLALAQLGAHTKDTKEFKLAQVDLNANDIDHEVDVHTPSMKLFSKGKEEPASEHSHELELNSENHFDGMKKFLKDNSDAYAKAFPDEHIASFEDQVFDKIDEENKIEAIHDEL